MEHASHSFTPSPTFIPREYDAQRKLAHKEHALFNSCISSTRHKINVLSISRRSTLQPYEIKDILDDLIGKCRNIISNNQTQLVEHYEEFIRKLNLLSCDEEVSFSSFSGRIIYLANTEFYLVIDVHILGVKALGDFSMLPEDLKRAGLSDATPTQTQMDCTLFAYYHLNDHLLTQEMIKDSQGASDLCHKHKDIHYKYVKKPKVGDIVAYGQLDFNGYTPLHAGVFKGNGRAISLWGEGGTVMEHGIAEVPLSYGNCVLFNRKKHRFTVTGELVGQIDKAKDSLIGPALHSLCASPLSIEGTKAVFLQMAARCFKEQQETAFVRSFFGVRVLSPLFEAITAKVNNLHLAEGTGKAELLKELRSIVKKESFNLPIDFTLEGVKPLIVEN